MGRGILTQFAAVSGKVLQMAADLQDIRTRNLIALKRNGEYAQNI